MSGKIETYNRIEKNINKLLENAPDIIKTYSLCFNENNTTKFRYIMYACQFADYLKFDLYEDVNDIETFTSKKPSDINRYMEHIKYRCINSTKLKNGESIRAVKRHGIYHFYEFLISEGYIDRNPCEKVKAPKLNGDKQIISLDDEEIERFKMAILDGIGTDKAKNYNKDWVYRNLAIFVIGYKLGLRVTAISEIDVSDIDFKNKTIKVIEKGNKFRLIYFGDNTMNILLTWIQEREKLLDGYPTTDALFVSTQRTRMGDDAIRKMIKRYASCCTDKKITTHKLRSTCATRLYDKTNDIFAVQNTLGHKSIDTTKRYTDFKEEKKKEIAYIMD